MGRVIPNGFRLVGAMDAVIPPRHVQTEKASAEATHLPGKAVGDTEYANRRRCIPCTGGNGVGFDKVVAIGGSFFVKEALEKMEAEK